MRIAAALTTVLGFALIAAPAGAGVDGADYVTVRVSDPPAVLGIGAAMRVTDTTKNRGDSAGPGTRVRYYLSRDARRSRGDRLLGGRLVPALDAGQSSRGSATVTVPRVRPGGYRVIACVTRSCRASRTTVAVKRSAAPVALMNEPNLFSWVKGDPPKPIAPNLTVSDTDDVMMSGATVAITAPEPGEQLSFEPQLGVVTGTYDSGTGILTIRGQASTAAYQQVLRSVSYSHNGSSSSGKRTITFQVLDAVRVASTPVFTSIDVTVN